MPVSSGGCKKNPPLPETGEGWAEGERVNRP